LICIYTLFKRTCVACECETRLHEAMISIKRNSWFGIYTFNNVFFDCYIKHFNFLKHFNFCLAVHVNVWPVFSQNMTVSSAKNECLCAMMLEE